MNAYYIVEIGDESNEHAVILFYCVALLTDWY